MTHAILFKGLFKEEREGGKIGFVGGSETERWKIELWEVERGRKGKGKVGLWEIEGEGWVAKGVGRKEWERVRSGERKKGKSVPCEKGDERKGM